MMERRASSWTHRRTLLKVLEASSPSIHEEFIKEMGLLVLQKWLSDACKLDTRSKFIVYMLHLLDKLPITAAALEPPCILASCVSSLRKFVGQNDADAEKVRSESKFIRSKWKEIYQASIKPQREVAKEEKKGNNENIALKSVAAKTPVKPASRPNDKPSSGSSELKKNETKVHKNLSSTTGYQNATTLGDDDIFVAAEKKKILADQARAAQKRKLDEIKPSGKADSSDKKPESKKPHISTTHNTSRSQPLDILDFHRPSTIENKIKQNQPITFGYMELLTAKERAARAAARVPSPLPEVQKPKRKSSLKSVSWPVDDTDLVSIRYFYEFQPPEAVKSDVLPEDGGIAPNSDAKHFASAAKQEHLSEAEALRTHRQTDNEETEKNLKHLEGMNENVRWYCPIVIKYPMEVNVACGEESIEAKEAAVRRASALTTAAVYDSIESIPDSAREPLNYNIVQQVEHIPRIPLSLEEVRVANQPMNAAFQMNPLDAQATRNETQELLGHHLSHGESACSMLDSAQYAGSLDISSTLERLAEGAGIKTSNKPPSNAPQDTPYDRRSLRNRPDLHLDQKELFKLSKANNKKTKTRTAKKSSTVCRFFNSKDGCRHGDTCRFSHVHTKEDA